MYPGGLEWHQGIDIALRAFKQVCVTLPNTEFHIYGDGIARSSLQRLGQDLGLNDRVKFFDPKPSGEMAAIMAKADLGVVPKRADSFGNEAYSTKIMEFMAVGVPVVVSNTKVDRHYFDDSVVRFFESGNEESLAAQMLDLLANPAEAQALANRAETYAERHCWENRKADYLRLLDSLCVSYVESRATESARAVE